MMTNMAYDGRVRVNLAGVPETMLWPLWNRAAEHVRVNRLIDDPMAADLVGRIAYDFAETFGKPSVLHAVRARVGDDLIKEYLRAHPAGSVVALGEGLETQLWRAGNDSVRWFSVDLPDAIATRRSLLPDDLRVEHVPCSALDPSWMDAVPDGPPPFISAAGLLMYFQEHEVHRLLVQIAQRFPGAQIYFDTIPPWLSRKTQRGLRVTKSYTAPPMPWGISLGAIPTLIRSFGNISIAKVETFADPFPHRMGLIRWLNAVAPIRNRFAPGLVHLVAHQSRS